MPLPLTFCMRSVAVERVRNGWKRIARSCRYECDVAFPDRAPVSFELRMSNLGECRASCISLPVHTLRRSLLDIHRDGYRKLSIYRMVSGAAVIAHPGGETPLAPGQCILVDHGTPHERRFHQPSVLLGLHMPRTFVASVLPYPENAAFNALPAQGWGGVLSAAMGLLDPACLAASAASPDAVSRQIATLLALAQPLVHEPMKSGRLALLNRLRQSMSTRLHDFSLGPDVLAADEGISKRTLHALFAECGTTFRAELVSMRLEAARRMLEDRRFWRHSIGEIAVLCGFVNASHFGRRFRECHGMSPAAYRSLFPRSGCDSSDPE